MSASVCRPFLRVINGAEGPVRLDHWQHRTVMMAGGVALLLLRRRREARHSQGGRAPTKPAAPVH